jgi:hypothetical protein
MIQSQPLPNSLVSQWFGDLASPHINAYSKLLGNVTIISDLADEVNVAAEFNATRHWKRNPFTFHERFTLRSSSAPTLNL